VIDTLGRLLPARLRSRFETSATLRRLVPNTGWLVADRLARMAVSLLVSMLLARYLGPAVYGRYNFAIAWVSLFSAFATLGLERIAVRELVAEPDDVIVTLGSAWALRFVGGAFAWFAATVAMLVLRRSDAEMQAMVAIMSGAYVVQAFDVIDYWNQSRARSKTTVIAMSAAFVLAAATRIVLVLTHGSLLAFAWVWSAELMLGSIGLAVVYRAVDGPLSAWRLARARLRSLARDGSPIMLSGVMVMVYSRIDQVLLGQMSTAHELGIYASAVKLVEMWYFLPSAVAISVFPSVVEALQVSPALFEARLVRLYDLMSRMSYAIALPISLAAPWIVRIVFGPAYAAAAPMLSALIWSIVFTNLGTARGLFLSAMNWTWAYFMTVTVGCIVNVGLNLLLIPRMGGMGAVIASIVSYWAASHGSCFLYRPLFRTGVLMHRALWPWHS